MRWPVCSARPGITWPMPVRGTAAKNEIIAKGAILTRNQKHASAQVTYSCKSGIYSSKWSISTNRNDNLRDYEMEIADLSSGKLIDLKKSDVPAKNEALIGLNYNQFIKAVLLAQGEFDQADAKPTRYISPYQ